MLIAPRNIISLAFSLQLNLYDFHRIHDGPHQGAYFHRLFIQGHAVLSTKMVRNKVIRKPKAKKKKKSPEASEDEAEESDDELEEDDEQIASNGQKSAKAVSDGSSSPSNSTTRNGMEQI